MPGGWFDYFLGAAAVVNGLMWLYHGVRGWVTGKLTRWMDRQWSGQGEPAAVAFVYLVGGPGWLIMAVGFIRNSMAIVGTGFGAFLYGIGLFLARRWYLARRPASGPPPGSAAG